MVGVCACEPTVRLAETQNDRDSWKDSELARQLQSPRRSALVVLKGDRELARIVADTSEPAIRALFDVALQAATSASS
jgi:hypothetical protein